jgi:ubiquinone/menaquinone biosynthesis C-methylase UbiE
MTGEKHDTIVRGQFSAQARAYLASAVHAAGEDLDLMERLVGTRPDAVALDMGSGPGHVAFRLSPLVGRVVACDLSEAMLGVLAEEAARRGLTNVATVGGAAETLPFPAASFDVLVTRHSAHHWRDVPAALREMRRVSKPGAVALFIDGISPGRPLLDTWLQTLELLRDPSHVRNYSLGEWREMLISAGFVPGEPTQFRLRLDFKAWIERMKTPAPHVEAIRSLQRRAGLDVTDHFVIEDDGSFVLDTALIPAAIA